MIQEQKEKTQAKRKQRGKKRVTGECHWSLFRKPLEASQFLYWEMATLEAIFGVTVRVMVEDLMVQLTLITKWSHAVLAWRTHSTTSVRMRHNASPRGTPNHWMSSCRRCCPTRVTWVKSKIGPVTSRRIAILLPKTAGLTHRSSTCSNASSVPQRWRPTYHGTKKPPPYFLSSQ